MKTHTDFIRSLAADLSIPPSEAVSFFWWLVNEGSVIWHPYRGYVTDGYVDLHDLYATEFKGETT